MKTIVALALTAALMSGCATMGGWEPTVDRAYDRHPETVDQDLEQCRQLAEHASGGVGNQAATGAAVGAVGGAVVGGLLGSISGHPGGGMAEGAVLGGGVGAASQGSNADHSYKASYIRCMKGRGHHVIG